MNATTGSAPSTLAHVERLTVLGELVDRYSYRARRLRLSFLEWGNPDRPTLILLHGGLESGHSWDQLASRLCHDWRVIAPDLRGHGESDWALGGAYAVLDYVADIVALLHARQIDRAVMVGHSLGGAVAVHMAALYPERVDRVCAIEGLRPVPQQKIKPVAEKIAELRRWSDDLIALTTRPTRIYPSQEAAANHLMSADPMMPRETALHAAQTNMRAVPGGFSWKYDTHLRQFSSIERIAPDPQEFWQLIVCPTLLVYGSESWASDPEEDGRIAHFSNARVVKVPGAGHNLQHHQPDAFHDLLKDFLQG